jgi:hypothetical protein
MVGRGNCRGIMAAMWTGASSRVSLVVGLGRGGMESPRRHPCAVVAVQRNEFLHGAVIDSPAGESITMGVHAPEGARPTPFSRRRLMKKSSTRASLDSLARSRGLSVEELANVTGGTPSIPIPPPLGDPTRVTPSIPIPPPLA